MLLPKKDGHLEDDRVLIVGQYKNACVYNINQGTTVAIGKINIKRGFSQIVKVNSEVYIVGGDFHTKMVEKYNDESGSFELIDISLMKGRSRFAHAVATKDTIRALGVKECV